MFFLLALVQFLDNGRVVVPFAPNLSDQRAEQLIGVLLLLVIKAEVEISDCDFWICIIRLFEAFDNGRTARKSSALEEKQ